MTSLESSEARTADRADRRVGSLAERQDLQIYVGIPFLAHAYEISVRRLHARAQKFEVAMGRLGFPT